MTPQETFLFVPQIIYYFLLSLFEISTLGYELDIGCIFVIALIFWLKIAEAVLTIIKKILGMTPKRPY